MAPHVAALLKAAKTLLDSTSHCRCRRHCRRVHQDCLFVDECGAKSDTELPAHVS